MIWNAARLALRSIGRNALRSFLTMLGVVIGVAAVVTMVTLGRGATRAVQEQIAAMGTNQLTMIPGQRFGPGSEGASPFKLGDVVAIRDEERGVSAVAPVVARAATVVYQAENWSTVVSGTTNDYFEVGNWRLAAGRTFSEPELESGRAVCILGETVRMRLFHRADPVGRKIRVKQFTCEVIGLLQAKGQGGMGFDQDDTVLLPLRTAQRRITGTTDVQRIVVAVSHAGAMDEVKAGVARVLRERRKISPEEDDDFRIMDMRQLTEALTGTTRILTLLLGAVAAVSLLVGGIGIMNIMLVSVTERTREIGIRLAIGALGRDVMLQFLVEGVMLAVIGGALGVILAAGASIALARLMAVPFMFDPGINLAAWAFSGAIGVLFGFVPARRAALLDPIEALRYE